MGKNDGVLTSADFYNQKNIEKEQVKPASFPKNVQIQRQYIFPPAPMGKSHTTIIFENKSMRIELIDKIYIPPKEWNESKLDKFHRVIQIYGFKDKSYVIGKKEAKKEEKEKVKKIYKVGHPDNTSDEKVKGNVSINVNDKDYQFTLENGVIEITEEKIYKAFLKKGWYEVSIKEVPIKKIPAKKNKKED
jgi:hypothetical protein